MYSKSVKFSSRGLGKSGEFMIKAKGRPFIFESFIKESLPPDTFFGRWAVSASAKLPWRDLS